MPSTLDHSTAAAVTTYNADGAGAVVLLCEHASCRFPDEFGNLGLDDATRQSHVAWDPGALAVSLGLSKALDAPLVAGTVSRLIYDCNRPPEVDSAIPTRSEVFDITGNTDLTVPQRQARVAQVYVPFCDAVAKLISDRKRRGQPTVIVTMHSFTPIYFGKPRPVEIGILHDSDSRLADAMLAVAAKSSGRRVERNEPYGPQDGVTHSLQLHGLANGFANVMIEIRNDLLRSPQDQAAMTSEILTLLRPAVAQVIAECEDGTHA